MGPFDIPLTKAGYETYTDLFAPTIDTEETNKTIKLKEATAGGTVIYDSTIYDSTIY